MLVYMGIVAAVGWKTIPKGAKEIINGVKGAGAAIWTHGLKPVGKGVWAGAKDGASKSKRIQKWAQKAATQAPPSLKKKFGTSRLSWAVQRPLATALGPKAIEARRIAMKQGTGMLDKIQDPHLALAQYRTLMSKGKTDEATGMFSGAVQKGGALKKVFEENIPPEEATKLASEANRIGTAKEAKAIGLSFIDSADKMGFKSYKGYETIQQKLIGEARGDEIKQLAAGFWQSPEAQSAIQTFWGGAQLNRAAQEFGGDFTDKYRENLDKKAKQYNMSTTDYLVQANPKQLLYLSGNAAQDAGFTSPGGLGRKEVREKINAYKRGEYAPKVIFALPHLSSAETKEEENEKNREQKKKEEKKREEREKEWKGKA